MDVTFTTKFDAKQYARAVRRALAFSFRGFTAFSWCLMAACEEQNGVCPQRKREICCYSCALQVNMLLYCLLRMEKGYETTDKAVSKGGGGT